MARKKERKNHKQILLKFSNELASCMAKPSHDQQQILQIINNNQQVTSICEKNLKARSLLNRNSKDDYKFAHKSFMEYLVAKQLIKQKEDTGWFSLENVDCVSNDMIPLFLFYMMSNGKPIKITFSDNKLTFSNNLYSPEKYALSSWEQIICVDSDYSAIVENNLFTFIKTICNIKNNSWPVNIIIDCKNNYIGLEKKINDLFFDNDPFYQDEIKKADFDKTKKTLISTRYYYDGVQFILPKIIFENYDFMDEKMLDFIYNLNHNIICYFVINDYEAFASPQKTIMIQRLRHFDSKLERLYVIDRAETKQRKKNHIPYVIPLTEKNWFDSKIGLIQAIQNQQKELNELNRNTDNASDKVKHKTIELCIQIGEKYIELYQYNKTFEFILKALYGIESYLISQLNYHETSLRDGILSYEKGYYEDASFYLEKALKNIETNYFGEMFTTKVDWIPSEIKRCTFLTIKTLNEQQAY